MTNNEILFHAYCLAAAFLTVELRENGVEEACEVAGHSEKDIQAIREGMEQIIRDLTSMATHFGRSTS